MKPCLFTVGSCRAIWWGLALLVCAGTSCAGQELANIYRITTGVSNTANQYRVFKIARGEEAVLADLQGPGKITYFYITDNTDGNFYPGLVLKIFWDDAKQPSIQVPLADFFGAIGGRTIDYESLPMQIQHLCYMCYLPMPFSKSARVVLANDGEKDYTQNLAYSLDFEKDAACAGEPSRLHSCWRRSNPTDGMHTFLETRGHGHYVGNFLQVFSRYKGWWGEGDTIFHTDGKTVTHSPGTEDEYGSCWGFGKLYQYAYSGYLENASGHNRMYRWYLTHPVRFQQSLKVEIQNQHWENKTQTPSRDDYISVAFWYLDHAEPVTLVPFIRRTEASQAMEYEK